MRVIKISPGAFERAVTSQGRFGKFVKIPSSNDKYTYTGILLANGVGIPWPDNLTDEELKLYEDRYGSPPDIFELKEDKKMWTPNTPRVVPSENKGPDETS